MRHPRGPDWTWLRTSPLLLGAIVAIVAASRLASAAGRGNEVAAALVVLGAVLLGAWIALLASHGYPGHDDHDPPEMKE